MSFRSEIEDIGFTWRGHGSFMTLNASLMNKEISKGCDNAISDFEKYVELLFSNNNDELNYNRIMSQYNKMEKREERINITLLTVLCKLL